MTINDQITQRFDHFYQDEYQRSVAHQSSTVALYWTTYASLVLAPILAWSLDGKQAYLSFLALIPVFLGAAMGSGWMRKRVPAPAFNPLVSTSWAEWALSATAIILWILGLTRNGEDGASGSMFIGAALGAAAALIALPLYARWRHNRDVARLNSRLED